MKRQITTAYTGQHFKTRNGLMNLMDYKATHEELHSIHIMLNSNSLRETLDTNAYKRNLSKKLPPTSKGSHSYDPQATLLYDNALHATSAAYTTASSAPYPPSNDVHRVLLSYPRVITPLKGQDLSPIRISIYPNSSYVTNDVHRFDTPAGSETDITILFYKEDNIFHDD